MKAWTRLILILLFVAAGCARKMEAPNTSVSPIATATQQPSVLPIPTPFPDWATDTPDPVEFPIIISDVVRNEDGLEIIKITNISGSEQSLSNITLLRPATLEYLDLPDITLLPGETFNVYNGASAAEASDGVAWLDEPALRVAGDDLVLLNSAGRVIWTYVNYRDYP